MRKTLTAATFAAALGIANGVQAADLNNHGMKDEAGFAPATGWTGLYAGIGIGGGAVYHDLSTDLPSAGDLSIFSGTYGAYRAGIGGSGGNGILGTIQLGYDYQIAPGVIVGAFADGDLTGISSTLNFPTGDNSPSNSLKLNDSWSIGGRAGYLVKPDTLVYVLGAYTQADFGFPSGFNNSSFPGYSVGGGIETRICSNWFLKGEYRFSQFEKQTVYIWENLIQSPPPVAISDAPSLQTGRLSLVYKLSDSHAPFK